MSEYDPDRSPDPETWLDSDEEARIAAIVRYHEASDIPEPDSGWRVHAALHCVVENQIAMKTGNVFETQKRLRRQGLTRHDAIHAIGAVIGSDLFGIAQGSNEFDEKRYRRKLEKLTAKRWLKGKY